MFEKLPFSYSSEEAKLFRRWDEIAEAEFETQRFDELLRVADALCLKESPNYQETAPVGGEAAVVEKLGTRGLKAALEFTNGTLMYRAEVPSGLDIEDIIIEDTPMRKPTQFGKSLNRSALRKAEQFGAQLMKESIDILGPDAVDMIEVFKNAQTLQEQFTVIEWLEDRIAKIAKAHVNDENSDVRDGFFYHPIRLSPQAIGSHPNTTASPTCLGVSVIAAGFFQAAGADVLHADVAEQDDDASALVLLHHIKSLETNHIHDAPLVKESLQRMSSALEKHLNRRSARHAAVYVKLGDGCWVQFDPNFHATTATSFEKSDRALTNTLVQLNATKEIAPGLESFVALEGMDENIGMHMLDLGQQFDTDRLLQLRNEVAELYASGISESLAQRTYETIVQPFVFGSVNIEYVRDDLTDLETAVEPGFTEDLFENRFHALFAKYVLWGEDVDTFLERCSEDLHYLGNRVADTETMIRVLLVDFTRAHIDAYTPYKIHASIEAGLPAQRIGLAVLSDFNQFTDSQLGPNFWLSNWPGDVALTENLKQLHPLDASWPFILNNDIHRSLNPLTTSRNQDIIDTFIRQARSRDEDTHAQTQETQSQPEDD